MHTYYQRRFLNTEKEGGTAFLQALVHEITTATDGNKSFEAGLTIADCNRIVDLNFDVYNEEDCKNVRQKITALRRVVIAFEKIVLAQIDEVEGR